MLKDITLKEEMSAEGLKLQCADGEGRCAWYREHDGLIQ